MRTNIDILKWEGKLQWEGDESIDWTQRAAERTSSAAVAREPVVPSKAKAAPGANVVVADSSVWIDFFNARPNPARDALRRLLYEGEARVVVPDLVLFEELRGPRGWRH